MKKYNYIFLKYYYYILYYITPVSYLKVLYYATYMLFKCSRYDKFRKKWFIFNGMCYCIAEGFKKVYNEQYQSYNYIHLIIPEFNIKTAKLSFNANNDISCVTYWWGTESIKERYDYFKYLIKIYKNK